MSSTDMGAQRQPNRLASEASLYLQQHGHNPVDWYAWGAEALDRARQEDRPIFLSIGYASCHWCHVMEREVFEDEEVAELLNRYFVPIKVDREERPDLDAVYMEAVMAMTGNGGWPMSVFLLPDRRPFFGATYIPKDQFMQLLVQINVAYHKERGQLRSVAQKLYDHVAAPLSRLGGDLDDDLFERVARQAVLSADREWGGLKARMKFPMPVRWQFLLRLYRKTGNTDLAAILRLTLDQMAAGGVNDHLAGGFHRYAVERTWLVPHFEKMLYDNALLANLYLEAAAAFDEPRYAAVGADILDFLDWDMRHPEGGLYASLDADSEGEEGTYYLWTPEQITALAGPEDGPVLAALFGVESGGNFEGRSILTRRVDVAEVAARFERDPLEVEELLTRYREVLRQERKRRPEPGLDRKVITSWNGLGISALARGHRLLGEERYLKAAVRTADYLWRVHRREDGRLYRASNDGKAGEEAILDDYAYFALGLIDLYQASGDPLHLERSLELLAVADAHFLREEGGYFLTPKDHEAPLGRQLEMADGVRPSGLGTLLQAHQLAAELTGDAKRLELVKRHLAAFGSALNRAELEMASWLDVVLKLRGPFFEVVVAGDGDDPLFKDLSRAARKSLPAQAVLVTVPATGPSEAQLKLLTGAQGKKALTGKATAFVCQWGACQNPTHDPDELRAQITRGWQH